MRRIKISQGEIALVDDDDWKKVCDYSWWLTKKGYAKAWIDGKHQVMHRVILDPPTGVQVDHIDGNKLDNRRKNLRLTDNFGNTRNAKRRKDNTSGFKGVHFRKDNRKWIAYISNTKLGCFDTIEEAIAVRRKAAREKFGSFNREEQHELEECTNCHHTYDQHHNTRNRCTGCPITSMQSAIDGSCPCRDFISKTLPADPLPKREAYKSHLRLV